MLRSEGQGPSACQPNELICNISQEVGSVLCEFAFVVIGLALVSKLLHPQSPVQTKKGRKSDNGLQPSLAAPRVPPRARVVAVACDPAAASEAHAVVDRGDRGDSKDSKALQAQYTARRARNTEREARGVCNASDAVAAFGTGPLYLMLRANAEEGNAAGIVRVLGLISEDGLQLDGAAFDYALSRFPMLALPASDAHDLMQICEALVVTKGLATTLPLSSLMHLFAHAGAWGQALTFLASLPERADLKLDTLPYAKLGVACVKAGARDGAFRVYEAMIEKLGATAVAENAVGRHFRNMIIAPQGHSPLAASIGPPASGKMAETLESWCSQHRRFSQFISLNGIDRRCERLLRSLSLPQLEWVMDQEFIIDVDPSKGTASSKVVGRANSTHQQPDSFWKSYPTSGHLEMRFAAFLSLNDFDERCLKLLKGLQESLLRNVMDCEYVIRADPSRGTASAKVIGNVMKLRHTA